MTSDWDWGLGNGKWGMGNGKWEIENTPVPGDDRPPILKSYPEPPFVDRGSQKIIVKPWSKSKSGPRSQQAPKSNKSPPKKEEKKDLDLGLTLKSHGPPPHPPTTPPPHP